jgi:hypothetical protein
MAAFKQHVTFSSVLGVGYAAGLYNLGVGWVHSVLAGGLCGFAGMLPDLDSASGRPVREVFGIAALAVPLLLARRLQHAGLGPEEVVLAGAGLYLLIRFGLAWVFRHLTVHRGMFHSLPAALIAGEAVFLADDGAEPYGRLTLAGGVVLGFLSHLILDEIYSVDMSGMVPRLNQAAGSAVKLFSKSVLATLCTWVLLGCLTYLVGVSLGLLQPVRLPWPQPVATRGQGDHRAIPNSVPGAPEPGPRR